MYPCSFQARTKDPSKLSYQLDQYQAFLDTHLPQGEVLFYSDIFP